MSGCRILTKTSTILLAVLICSQIGSLARADFAQDFHKAAAEIPNALIRSDQTEFGRLNLTIFLNRIPSVLVRQNDAPSIRRLNDGLRSTAHWTTKNGQRAIEVSLVWWNHFSDQQPVLALHEYLGEFGFPDDQYWVSTSLWALTRPEASVLTVDQRARISRWIIRNVGFNIAGGGTVTGVGGGGESATLWWRMNCIVLHLRGMANALTAAARQEKWEQVENDLVSVMNSGVDGITDVHLPPGQRP